jgi:hypothetical protein
MKANKPLERAGMNAWRPAEHASAGRSAPIRSPHESPSSGRYRVRSFWTPC